MSVDSTVPPSPTLDDEVKAALSACQGALRGPLAGLPAVLKDPPRTPEAWFDLLEGCPQCAAKLRKMRDMAAVLPAAPWPKGSGERYALLQAFIAALPRLPTLPVDATVKRLVCAAVLQVASPDKRHQALFDVDGPAFEEMAKIATLRQFPAGQLSFDRTTLPHWWLLKVHPLALPGLLFELATAWNGFGPVISPHVYHWRPNPLFLLKGENERALYRMAKTLELQPEIKGLMADSWFYSAEVGRVFPHLAWLRDFFVEQSAYQVDLEPADPDSGFMIGSAKRRRMFEEGKFRPRQTLFLWRRRDLLAWAAAHPELADSSSSDTLPHALSAAPDPQTDGAPPPSVKPTHGIAFGWLVSGRFTCINAVPFLSRHPRLYILSALVAPSAVAALSTALAVNKWLAAPVFLAAFLLTWVLQYFLLQ